MIKLLLIEKLKCCAHLSHPIGDLLVEDALKIKNYTFKKDGAIFHNHEDIPLDGVNILKKGSGIWISGNGKNSNFIGILQHYIYYFD
jgi:hypothetical protein